VQSVDELEDELASAQAEITAEREDGAQVHDAL
jgi:hypothetical protein